MTVLVPTALRVLVAIPVAQSLSAQAVAGTVSGMVADSSGAIVPTAAVTSINDESSDDAQRAELIGNRYLPEDERTFFTRFNIAAFGRPVRGAGFAG